MLEREKEFIVAAKSGNNKNIASLINSGVNVNCSDSYGDTALIWAAFNGHTETVKLLCSNSADPNIKGLNGNTALHWAAHEGHVDIIKVLIANHADSNIKNDNQINAADFAYLNKKSYYDLLNTSNNSINITQPTPRLFP